MQTPEVFVVRDHGLLLEAVAARLVTVLVDHIYARDSVNLLVQASPVVTDVFQSLAAAAVRAAVDWEHVNVWCANRSPEHPIDTVVAALSSLGVPPANLHLIPLVTSDQHLADVADAYAQELRTARGLDDHGAVPAFDIALLVVGEAGSVAGLYPERPSAYNTGAVAVDQAASEVTLTPSALSTAREVWLIGTGKDAAGGVHLALTGGPLQVPAAGARGQLRTLMLLDEPAAAALPSSLRRLASP